MTDFDPKLIGAAANDIYKIYKCNPVEAVSALSITLVAIAYHLPGCSLEHLQGCIAAQWQRVADRGGEV